MSTYKAILIWVAINIALAAWLIYVNRHRL
jgi:hypothetical protein